MSPRNIEAGRRTAPRGQWCKRAERIDREWGVPRHGRAPEGLKRPLKAFASAFPAWAFTARFDRAASAPARAGSHHTCNTRGHGTRGLKTAEPCAPPPRCARPGEKLNVEE